MGEAVFHKFGEDVLGHLEDGASGFASVFSQKGDEVLLDRAQLFFLELRVGIRVELFFQG